MKASAAKFKISAPKFQLSWAELKLSPTRTHDLTSRTQDLSPELKTLASELTLLSAEFNDFSRQQKVYSDCLIGWTIIIAIIIAMLQLRHITLNLFYNYWELLRSTLVRYCSHDGAVPFIRALRKVMFSSRKMGTNDDKNRAMEWGGDLYRNRVTKPKIGLYKGVTLHKSHIQLACIMCGDILYSNLYIYIYIYIYTYSTLRAIYGK